MGKGGERGYTGLVLVSKSLTYCSADADHLMITHRKKEIKKGGLLVIMSLILFLDTLVSS